MPLTAEQADTILNTAAASLGRPLTEAEATNLLREAAQRVRAAERGKVKPSPALRAQYETPREPTRETAAPSRGGPLTREQARARGLEAQLFGPSQPAPLNPQLPRPGETALRARLASASGPELAQAFPTLDKVQESPEVPAEALASVSRTANRLYTAASLGLGAAVPEAIAAARQRGVSVPSSGRDLLDRIIGNSAETVGAIRDGVVNGDIPTTGHWALDLVTAIAVPLPGVGLVRGGLTGLGLVSKAAPVSDAAAGAVREAIRAAKLAEAETRSGILGTAAGASLFRTGAQRVAEGVKAVNLLDAGQVGQRVNTFGVAFARARQPGIARWLLGDQTRESQAFLDLVGIRGLAREDAAARTFAAARVDVLTSALTKASKADPGPIWARVHALERTRSLPTLRSAAEYQRDINQLRRQAILAGRVQELSDTTLARLLDNPDIFDESVLTWMRGHGSQAVRGLVPTLRALAVEAHKAARTAAETAVARAVRAFDEYATETFGGVARHIGEADDALRPLYDQWAKQNLDLGIFNEDTFLRHSGFYSGQMLYRAFDAVDATAWLRQPTIAARLTQLGVLEDVARARGLAAAGGIPSARAARVLPRTLNDEEIRLSLGQYDNALKRLQASTIKISSEQGRKLALDEAADTFGRIGWVLPSDSPEAVARAVDKWPLIPDDPQSWGALAGKTVAPELYTWMAPVRSLPPALLAKWWGRWKASLILPNPRLYGIQAVYNTAVMSGQTGLSWPRAVALQARALREMLQGAPSYREFVRLQPSAAADALTSAEFQFAKGEMLAATSPMQLSRLAAWRGRTLYGWQDAMAKYATHLHYTEAGMPAAIAAEKASALTGRYPEVPRWVEWTANSPLMPFVRFPYTVLAHQFPELAPELLANPDRLIKPLVLYHLIHDRSDPEERRLARFVLRRPLSANEALAPVRGPGNYMLVSWRGLQPLPQLLTEGDNPLRQIVGVDVMTDIALNRNRYTGGSIWEEKMPDEERAEATARYARNFVAGLDYALPHFAPGFLGGYDFKFIRAANTKQPLWPGGPVTGLPEAILSRTLPMQFRTVNLIDGLIDSSIRYRGQLQAIKRELGILESKQNRAIDAGHTDAVTALQRDIDRQKEALNRIISLLENEPDEPAPR